jgi:alkaline phosphatase
MYALRAGMFAYSHMEFETDRKQKDQIEPSLAEMTVAAIKVLKKNSRGFFLFVEGTELYYFL